jgi:hypothetical protein
LYEGYFIDGKLNGFGRALSEDFIYEGGFSNDSIEGWGAYKDREVHAVGEFKNDDLNGQGVLTKNRLTLVGTFKGWNLHGFGEIRFPDTTKWSGEWLNGPKGLGVMTLPNGTRKLAILADVKA